MALAKSRLFYLSLSLPLLCFCLFACSSQEDLKEAPKEKVPPVSAPPAAPAGGTTTSRTAEEYISQGKEFLNAKQYGQAILKFGEAIKLNPQSIQALNSRGIAYCNLGDFDRALGDFSSTLEIDPNFGKGYNNRAVAYFMKGERDKARRDVEKAQSLGIPVNQTLVDSLKQGEAKAEEKGKGPAQVKPKAEGKGETKKK
jgi:Tfp pilus assembly protein PilF